MKSVQFIDSGRLCRARVLDSVPEEEPLQYDCGHDQYTRVYKLSGAHSATSYDDGDYIYYLVDEYLGSQNDDPEEVESNTEHYYAAVWYEFDMEEEP